MRKIIGSICAVALLAPSSSAFAQTASERLLAINAPSDTSEPSETGLCRRPLPLPQLGAEPKIAPNQQDDEYSEYRRPPPPSGSSPSLKSGLSVDATSRGVMADSRREISDGRAGSRILDPGSPGEAPIVDMTVPLPPGASLPPLEPYPRVPRPPFHTPKPPRPKPQSGLLTAGEHDDLLNPELYSSYVGKSNLGQAGPGLPRLDTERLLTIQAKDSRGRAMPFVPVEVRCADGNSISLQTVADGSVVFFPGLDRLGNSVQVRAGNSDWRIVDLSAGRGVQTASFTLNGGAAQVRKLDLVLVVDVTGSMSDELRFLQAELTSITDSLKRSHADLDIRVGFTFYRDKGDTFITQTYPLSSDIKAAKEALSRQYAGGGGDYEEAMQDALIRAAGQPWRDDAVKTLLLVADAPPHNQDIKLTWRAAEHLRGKRVHIVPVGASGVADMAEYLMRAMAAATQSRYTFLTDDSGIGNSHAAPAIDCYLVTRLDALLRRIIDSQISGRRIEPNPSEIIRRVGQYDAGKCILPSNYPQN